MVKSNSWNPVNQDFSSSHWWWQRMSHFLMVRWGALMVKHNNPIPLDDDHDVYPATGTTSGTALSIISICDPLMLLKSRYLPGPIWASAAPYEHPGPIFDPRAPYSCSHPTCPSYTHRDTRYEDLLKDPTSSYVSILHTGTPAMKSCSLRISAHCPTSKFDTIFMLLWTRSKSTRKSCTRWPTLVFIHFCMVLK